MIGLKKRLEKVENSVQHKAYAPVLFVKSEEEIENKRHLIGPNTVVILDNIGD